MNDYLMHYGILGMKWGIRRYQNADGSLTDAGKKRYSISDLKRTDKASSKHNRKTPNKKALMATGAVIAGTILLSYGAYSLSKANNDNTYTEILKNRETINKTWDKINKEAETFHPDISKFDTFKSNTYKDEKEQNRELMERLKNFQKSDKFPLDVKMEMIQKREAQIKERQIEDAYAQGKRFGFTKADAEALANTRQAWQARNDELDKWIKDTFGK